MIKMENVKMILAAISFINTRHKGQKRKASGDPYTVHPLLASYVLVKYKSSKHLAELIVAMLLHDTLEDTKTTMPEIAIKFTPLVATIVQEMTNDEEEIKKVGKNAYFKVKLMGISSYALTCKLIDRLVNIWDSPKSGYVSDTIDLINHLKKNRKLSGTQKQIAEDILLACSKFAKNN